jgi:DNA-directed RNA polymerase subunit RPC12/RpoP
LGGPMTRKASARQDDPRQQEYACGGCGAPLLRELDAEGFAHFFELDGSAHCSSCHRLRDGFTGRQVELTPGDTYVCHSCGFAAGFS